MIEGLGLLGIRKEAAAYRDIVERLTEAARGSIFSGRSISKGLRDVTKQADKIYNDRLLNALKKRYARQLGSAERSLDGYAEAIRTTSNPKKFRKLYKQWGGAVDDLDIRLRAIDQAGDISSLKKIRSSVLPRYNPEIYNGSAAKQLKARGMLPKADTDRVALIQRLGLK